MRVGVAWGWMLVWAGGLAGAPAEPSGIGVVVLAHGGNRTWNDRVREAVREANLPYPHELVLGMGVESRTPYQLAVSGLERGGARVLIVVPLLVSSHSEVYWQYEYLFGLRAGPGFPPEVMHLMHGHGGHGAGEDVAPLSLSARVVMTRALDADPLAADILVDRAASISREASKEAVVLVGHGPNDDTANAGWLSTMALLAGRLQTVGGYRNVRSVTLREDAARDVRARATKLLREEVKAAGADGPVLVIPLLMSDGGIEKGIPERLRGLPYRWQPAGLLPHPKVGAWIRARVEQLASSIRSVPRPPAP